MPPQFRRWYVEESCICQELFDILFKFRMNQKLRRIGIGVRRGGREKVKAKRGRDLIHITGDIVVARPMRSTTAVAYLNSNNFFTLARSDVSR